MNNPGVVCLPVLIMFLALTGPGCRPAADEELVIISPHSPEIRHEFSIGFAQWYLERTGRTAALKWLDVGGTGESIEYIRSRNTETSQAGGVDLFFGGGDYPFIKLGKMGLLVPYPLSEAIRERVPAELNGVRIYPDDMQWCGAALSGFGIVYNRKIISDQGLPVPAVWEDLARPACAGWVASGDPRYSGSIHMMYEVLLQAYGWEKGWQTFGRMGGNIQTFTKGASSAAKDVSLGQAAYGLAIDFYAFTEIERYGAARLGFVLPEGETVITPDGIGILKNAPRPDLAALFMEYVLTAGQKLWVFKKGMPGGPADAALCRAPVDATLYASDPDTLTVTVNPYTVKSTFVYDSARGGRRWSVLNDLVAAFIITPHTDLKACWAEIRRRGLPPEEGDKYFRVDISEEEAMAYAEAWDKPEFAGQRIALMNAWTAAAVARYHSVFE